MKLKKFFTLSLLALLVYSCDKNDDGPDFVPERDRGEQAIDDDQAIIEFLATHFYNYEEFENPSEDFDYVVRFDTIAGENASKIPVIDSDKLITKTVNFRGVDQLLYVLKVREGEGDRPAFTDSTFVADRGQLLNETVFETNLQTPVWFDLSGYEARNPQNGNIIRIPGLIPGFSNGITEFKAATGFEVNSDNTITWNNDYGVGAIILPSGLGYFSAARINIPSYSPLIFSVNLYTVNEADHDGDGIPSKLEDVNGDLDVFNDDTDEDGLSNHSDNDDDGDGTPTREEIVINADGSVEFPDSNGNGTPDYLDADTFK